MKCVVCDVSVVMCVDDFDVDVCLFDGVCVCVDV